MLSAVIKPSDKFSTGISDILFSLCESFPKLLKDQYCFLFQIEDPFYFWIFSGSAKALTNSVHSSADSSYFTGKSPQYYLQILFPGHLLTNTIAVPFTSQSIYPGETFQTASSYEQTTLLRHFCSSMCALVEKSEPISCELARLKIQELLLLIYQGFGYHMFSSLLPSLQEEKRLMNKLVEDAIREHWNIRQMAERNHQSLSSFKRHFIHHFGITPGRYLRKQKLEMARQDLLNGKGLKECYLTYGYENASNFIQAFKRAYGATPKYFQARQVQQAAY